jgi:hypothetical protein
VSEADLDRPTGPYFLWSDPTLGCQRAPSDSPLTEYEKEQIALRKNLERLKTERLAREAANSKND